MKKFNQIVIVIFLTAASSLSGLAESNSPGQLPSAKAEVATYAFIVSGINRDPEERQAKDKAVIKLRKILTKDMKLKSKNIYTLVDKDSFVRNPSGTSMALNIKQQLEKIVLVVKPTDRFILYYTGQANIVKDSLRLNLPGSDITAEELAKWINPIKASQILIVLDCPGAGLAVKLMTGKNRIIICAARSDQRYSTRFSEFFVPALINPEADYDSNSKISVLEAFQHTCFKLDELYNSENLLMTETPVLEDSGDGTPSQQPWRYEEDKNDGLAASQFFLGLNYEQ